MEKPRSGRRWDLTTAMTGMLFLSVAFAALTFCIHSVLLNRIIDAYSLVGAAQGTMASVLYIGNIIALLALPFLQGRIRRQTLLLSGVVLQGAMLLLTGLIPNYALLIGCCFLAGVGFGVTDAGSNAAIVDLHGANSTKYLGMLHGSFGAGSLVAPLLLSALLTRNDWMRTFAICGLMFFAVAAVYFVLNQKARRSPTQQTAAPEQRLMRADYLDYARQRRNRLLIYVSFFYAISQTGLTMWLVRFMTVQFNAEQLGSVALSAYWICSTLSRFIAPQLKISPIKLCIGGIAIATVFLAIGVFSGSPAVMCVMCGLIGAVSGPFIPMILSDGALACGGRSVSLVTSVLMLSMSVGRIVIPPLISGIAASSGMQASMLLPVAAGVITALLAGWAQRTPMGTAKKEA